jgi:hypothetical protein
LLRGSRRIGMAVMPRGAAVVVLLAAVFVSLQLVAGSRVAMHEQLDASSLGDLSVLLKAAKAGKVSLERPAAAAAPPSMPAEQPQQQQPEQQPEAPAADSSATAAPRSTGTLACSSKLGFGGCAHGSDGGGACGATHECISCMSGNWVVDNAVAPRTACVPLLLQRRRPRASLHRPSR